MPVAVIISPNAIPSIHAADDDTSLFDALCELKIVPADAKSDPDSLKTWIDTLPAPSGWFADVEEAKAFQKRVQMEQDAKLVKDARDHFGISSRELTALIGLADPQGDGSPVRRIMSAKQGLSGPGRRALAYAVLHGALDRKDENEALNRIGNGSWRNVKRSDIRSERKGGGIKHN
ncbi:hypothetical protein [Roseibium sediminicola]|uniref:Uncharacterized protein n=1 Tax=Roseibium sediminicola TaxID=2933272 RepID=A0ABT0GR85_9HYPH|nr:hypothetical protein [Roseibium sp. CAU 1639]MCK7611948.1 hypothetical protein [Roseibium sp. CAU 1639]